MAEIAIDNSGNPLLDQFSEEGFVDCTFRILQLTSTANSHDMRLMASYQGTLVGFRVLVRRGIRGGFDADMNLIPAHVYRSAVEFMRTGAESDAMVAALRKLYGMPESAARMADTASFTGIALHHDDVDMETQPIKIKLFGRDSDDEIERGLYFESFFNLDLPSGFVFWNEKDPDYRVPLIEGITGS